MTSTHCRTDVAGWFDSGLTSHADAVVRVAVEDAMGVGAVAPRAERKTGSTRSASRESDGVFQSASQSRLIPFRRRTCSRTTTLPASVPLPAGTRPPAESCQGPTGDAGGVSGLAASSNAGRARSDPAKSRAPGWCQALRCRTAGQVLLLRQHRADLFGARSGHVRGHCLAEPRDPAPPLFARRRSERPEVRHSCLASGMGASV